MWRRKRKNGQVRRRKLTEYIEVNEKQEEGEEQNVEVDERKEEVKEKEKKLGRSGEVRWTNRIEWVEAGRGGAKDEEGV